MAEKQEHSKHKFQSSNFALQTWNFHLKIKHPAIFSL